MNSSSGGDSTNNSSGIRTVPLAVKYPNMTPLLYIPTSTHQGNVNTVKVLPSSSVGIQRATPVIVTSVSTSSTYNSSFLQQNSSRSLLNKPPNPLSTNKNSQTIVVANSAGVIRSVPAAMVMGSGSHKKQIITLGNSIGNMGNQVSLLDPKNLKYIGAIIKNKKSEGSVETTNQSEQNVVLVSSSGATPVNSSSTYIVSKTSKPLSPSIVYTQIPASQTTKRVQVVLTTEGTLQSKPTISLVESGNFSASATNSKQEGTTITRIQPSVSSIPTTSTKPLLLPKEDIISQDITSKSETTSQEHSVQKQKTGKYIIPLSSSVGTYRSMQNPVIVPVKIKKSEESGGTGGRLQATSLGQIVSSNPTGSVTNFQISNGQIISEKVTKPRMVSLLYDNGSEIVKSCPQSDRSTEIKQETGKAAEEPAEMSPVPIVEERKVKVEPPIMRHRRKQELEVKDDTVRVPVKDSEESSQESDVKVKEEEELQSEERKADLSQKTEAADEESVELKAEPGELEKEDSTEFNEESEDNVNFLGVENSEAEKENVQKAKESHDADSFDLTKSLDWMDNIGSLPLSDLKFKLNEFGLIEIVEEDDEEGKISSKSSVVSDAEKSDGKHKKVKNLNNSDEILCCYSCGTYGMGCEFVSSRFCSIACNKAYAEEKAQSVKKQLQKQEKKMKLKQQKTLLLQQRAKLEKLGLHEAKITIEEKIKMLRMERELMKTNTGDSDFEGGSSTSGNTDRLRTSSRGSFSWTRYLTMLKAKSAPYTLFKDPFPATKNNFKIGMKLEGIDPVHPSLFCVLTVSAVRGYRIKLHFDGYPDCHDFWVNANSSDIFHAGWCERTNHKLSAPKGYAAKNFNWGNYLRMTRTVAAPKSCFVNNQEKTIIPSGFRTGMKLEAVDKKNSSLVCVATIADVIDNRILVHFDSWDDIYDYWVDCTSPYIHPVGWCKENGHQLTPPNDYKTPSLFSWDLYLRETKSLPAPARAFKPRTTTDFRRGMKLECVDKRNPILIRVATVIDVDGQQIKIKFDGWPDQYAYWVDDDSPDIHPAGWCHKTGHPLEPPPSEEDIKNTTVCPTPGCRGIGHVKAKHPVHHIILSCPYSSMNYLRDDHIPDRFCSKREYYEVKETSASKGTKPRPGIPRKSKPDSEPVSSQVAKPELRGRKRKMETTPSVLKKKARSNSCAEENIDPGSENEPPLWSKNNWDISETVASIGSNPLIWTPSQVAVFVENINNSPEKGKLFSEHQIDGEALLMLSQNDLVQILGFKLGPAIKLYKSIVLLRQRALEIKKNVSS